jgi:hypothetical protein
MWRGLWVGIVACSAVWVGCTTSTNDGKSGAPRDQGGAGGAEQACAEFELHEGKLVTQQNVVEPAPEPQGGEIVDGTYDLTAITVYEASEAKTGGREEADILRFKGNKLESLYLPRDEQEFITTYTFTAKGTELTRTEGCPLPDQVETVSYSATPTTYIEYLDGNLEMTYTKR